MNLLWDLIIINFATLKGDVKFIKSNFIRKVIFSHYKNLESKCIPFRKIRGVQIQLIHIKLYLFFFYIKLKIIIYIYL